MSKAVFLDRDGVINVDKGYVHKVEDFIFIPQAIEGLKILQDEGFKLFIVTNQSGIGHEMYALEDYEKVMDHMASVLEENGVHIIKQYFCPHRRDAGCVCRKPSPKLLMDAAQEFGIDLEQSYMIGDKSADILCGKNAGCTTVRVTDSKPVEHEVFEVIPDFTSKNLYEAAKMLQDE